MEEHKTRPPSETEGIKLRSRYLRGTLEASLADGTTGAVTYEDTKITKFHGIYQQDDRDLRAERAAQKLEPAYAFMIRVRIPGGILTPAQWLALDAITEAYADRPARLTTRQSVQLHGVLKKDLKKAVRAINDTLLTTIAACGDVNRTVACTSLPEQSALHRAAYEHALRVAEHLRPRTGAYREIWMDAPEASDAAAASVAHGAAAAGAGNGTAAASAGHSAATKSAGIGMATADAADTAHAGTGSADARGEEEPLYGPVYLPRKFKVGFAVPPLNDIDIYAQDLAFVAIAHDGKLAGFNVAVGGGLGATHGDPKTYPRLATTIGFCLPEQVLAVAEHVVGIQRDHGDRTERSHARFKYTVDDRGIDWIKQELERRLGFELGASAAARFVGTGDSFGWVRGDDGMHHLTIYVPAGRVRDTESARIRTGLNEIAKLHTGDLRITGNSNLIVGRVRPEDVAAVEALVKEHGLDLHDGMKPLRRNAMTCVALPTCGLAMAEAERYMPELLDKVEPLLEKHRLGNEDILLRMTGCPNGCARPYLAEIALIGKAPGRYNLFLGGGLSGERLNELHAQNLPESEILKILDELFERFAKQRVADERFGDFLRRTGVVAPVQEHAAAESARAARPRH